MQTKQIKVKTFFCEADAGTIKIIFGEHGAAFFKTPDGDGCFTVIVTESPQDNTNYYIGSFDVLSSAHLSGYDCRIEPVHEFEPGCYFVYHTPGNSVLISRVRDLV